MARELNHSWRVEARPHQAPLQHSDRSMSITRWLQFVRVRVCPLDGPKLKAWVCPSEWPRPDGPRLHTRLGISISFCRSLRDACHPSSTAQERFSLSAAARPDEHVHPPTAAGVTKPQTLDSGTPLDRKLACGVRHALDGTACKTQNIKRHPTTRSTCVGHRQCSRLVSWRGVASPPLPLGCGRRLH